MKPEYINDALAKVCPFGKWTVIGDDVTYADVVWLSTEYEMPEWKDIEPIVIILTQQDIATQYQRDRKLKYPPLADFADAYYWEKNGDNTKMQAYLTAVSAVKAEYPKGV